MKRRNFLALFFLPSAALAHSFKLGNVAIGHAWGLPTETSETSVMMPMLNGGTEPDALVSASSPVATSIELRDGAAALPEFALNSNRPFPMRAVAKHLQFIGLSKPLAKGDKLPLTLTFKNAGQIEIEVHIAPSAEE